MATESDSAGPGQVDHVAAGFKFMERLHLNKDEIFTASLGHDEDGTEQLLVVGGQTLVKVHANNNDEAEEVHRSDVRSVEVVPAHGLLLRFPGERWLHMVKDADAVYLRETIIESPLLPPRSATGHYIPPKGWQDDQIARLVGFVVMRAAEAEHNLGLVAAYGRAVDDFDRSIFGVTGKPLLDRLTALGETSPAIADMAERYGAWSKLRNQLVHSVRPTTDAGDLGPITHKPVMRLPGGEPYTVEKQDLPELVDLWYAFNWLYHDALRALIPLSTGVAAADLPLPDSVTGDERLPKRRPASAE